MGYRLNKSINYIQITIHSFQFTMGTRLSKAIKYNNNITAENREYHRKLVSLYLM